MKFYWKIFFCTMFMCVFFLTLGGYLIIKTSFQTSLEREIDSACEINNIVYYSLQNEFSDLLKHGDLASISDIKLQIKKTADSISISNMNDKLNFNIFDKDLNLIYTSLKTEFDTQLLKTASENEIIYSPERIGNKTFIRVIRQTSFLGEPCYVETVRDVSSTFENRFSQYNAFFKIVLAMLLLGGLINALISALLMKPIRNLTVATKEIASGHFEKRIDVTTTDEIAVLSEQFNIMSQTIEQKIEALKKEAENKELFVAAFSHELKTPLTAIIGFSDRLLIKLSGNEELLLYARYIHDEGKRLESLSMSLLTLVVLEKQDFDFQYISAQEFFGRIISVMTPVLREHQIEFKNYIEPGMLFIEPSLMETVCINLLDNARKAIHSNGEIILSGKSTKDGYSFAVQDNGVGLKEEELQKITRAFYMVDKSRSRKEGGAGLGLTICDKILQLHGGKIEFSSQPGVGTCAIVSLTGGMEA